VDVPVHGPGDALSVDQTNTAPTGSRRRALWLPVAALGLAILVPLAILLGTAWLFGWKFQPVETGSMAPAIPAGSLAVVQPIDPPRISPGTTIVFVDPLDESHLVAHRVVRVLPGTPLRYQTKGDANLTEDPLPIPVTSVRGIVAWVVPGLGSIVSIVQGAPAVLLLVILPLAVLLVTEVLDHRRRPVVSAAG
jgi:signal peptidase